MGNTVDLGLVHTGPNHEYFAVSVLNLAVHIEPDHDQSNAIPKLVGSSFTTLLVALYEARDSKYGSFAFGDVSPP